VVGTHAALVVEMATAASSRSAAAAPEQQRLTERDMRLKSRLAERVTDPTRFNRRVPDEFYETEEELGPLPEGWEKAFKGRQTYFVKYVRLSLSLTHTRTAGQRIPWGQGCSLGMCTVSHKTKETTWVDPRTEKTREHDITKIKPNGIRSLSGPVTTAH
jgi:hypothetical protein